MKSWEFLCGFWALKDVVALKLCRDSIKGSSKRRKLFQSSYLFLEF